MNGFVAEEDNNMELLEVDNTAVRENQISRIQAVKATRDQTSVDAALKELAGCAAGGRNLLDLAVQAMGKATWRDL